MTRVYYKVISPLGWSHDIEYSTLEEAIAEANTYEYEVEVQKITETITKIKY